MAIYPLPSAPVRAANMRLAACMAFALLPLAACNPQEATENPNPVAAPGARSQPGVTDEAREGTGLASRTAQTSAVMVSTTTPRHLVDASGRSLYALRDNENGSRCDAECEGAWPPVLVEAARPSETPGMPEGSLGLRQRPDGSWQVTYAGNPLYRYGGDAGVAADAGHGVRDRWGQWSLVGVDGKPLPAEAPGAAGDAAENTTSTSPPAGADTQTDTKAGGDRNGGNDGSAAGTGTEPRDDGR
jgi:predicted lipoprotein with Yx(FWY)xxD motif